MDIYSSYVEINRCIIGVLDSLNSIHPVVEEEQVDYVRLIESPFIVTDSVKRACDLVSAHDLNEYRNRFYSIKLEDSASSWLLDLLNIDKELFNET